ncbi:glycosyltransferase [Stigmatella hybrida]|uniref:glycosyltransferase n=1 Tax=Stigmatella hybrida TaxID=394097 RepID=UPI001CDADE1B|nr:glycosyltransferase [Stigmatella hybrida]
MGAPRFVFYAVNGLGLGHVTRLVSIARALRRLSPECEVLFLTSSEADHVIYREGFAAVKLPSKTIREHCGLRKGTYLKLAQTVTWNTLAAFDPDVLVVDTYPTGSFEELIPVLRWRQKNVFVFREQRAEAAGSGLLQASLRLYDRVLIPHDSVAQAGPVPEPAKALAVGPILIRERHELPTRAQARKTLGLPEEGTLLYASFGGGGDPEGARALTLTAQVVQELPGVRLVVGAGPLWREQPPALEGAVVLQGRYPALDFLPAFDAAVTAAGYNAVHELLYAGIPSVFIPFERMVDDQEKRAREVAAAGAGLSCVPLTRDGLAQAVREVLKPEVRQRLSAGARKKVERNGAEPAARALLELLT